MKMIYALLILVVSCTSPNPEPFVIAIGSCNKTHLPQPMWEEIINQGPDLWIWLGDNIYADSEDPEVLKEQYALQLQNPDYQQLIQSTEVIGTWDDHDYGLNNGGAEYVGKEASQDALLDFLGVPQDASIRDQEGVYNVHSYEAEGIKIKVILLDVRYHRDSLISTDSGYTPNEEGTILGAAQWAWLESQLTNSDADVHLIGSGFQILSAQHPYEKWANFPGEQERLLKLIAKTKPRGAVLLSGDRHIAEVSEIDVSGLSYPVRDITTSGLTHSYEEVDNEPNSLRISPLIGQKNYCLLTIYSQDENVVVSTQIRGLADTVFYSIEWFF